MEVEENSSTRCLDNELISQTNEEANVKKLEHLLNTGINVCIYEF